MSSTLVLYDEGCGACTALAAWIEQRGVGVAPIGSATGDRWLRDLGHRERYSAVHAIDAEGRRRTGGAAVPVILGALPRWGLLAHLARAWPRATRVAYRVLAANRGVLGRLLSGSTPASRGRSG